MDIYLKKFGVTLTSREDGNEALKAFQPSLKKAKDNEKILISFEGINTFSPSWGAEFLIPLYNRYKERLVLKNSENLSVQETVKLLEKIDNFIFSKQR
ncbi:DUF4325 domain-containing protein [Patescibacteria group bacterium]|nr:DUF4325 domain-containing protein [Patescibacteria group bacterium]